MVVSGRDIQSTTSRIALRPGIAAAHSLWVLMMMIDLALVMLMLVLPKNVL